jgi:aryl-alcohol dehydrogenase-like predicted oxidoreductase
VKQRDLGRTGPTVAALGLGCMGMSDLYGSAYEHESTATIRAALDAGVTLLDTGDYYAMGENEMLIRRALEARPGSRCDQREVRGPARPGRWLGRGRRAP